MDPTLNPDETTAEIKVTPRVVLGLCVMLAGLVLALDSLGFIEAGNIFRFWPLILIAVGVAKWMSPVPQKMSALIWVVAGTKLALPHSVVGVVVAEFLTGNKGVGFMLSSNANHFNAAGTFAAVAVLATISFTLDRVIFYLTRRALMWKEAGRHV